MAQILLDGRTISLSNVSFNRSHDLIIHLILAEVTEGLNNGPALAACCRHVTGCRVLKMDFAFPKLHLASRTVREEHDA
jgi:hypothetical protein